MPKRKGDIVPVTPDPISTALDTFTTGLCSYLATLGLPTEDVLVPMPERGRVVGNLPHVVDRVPQELRAESMYVSKFAAACAAGLFDAALNYLWDETVANLRAKAARFDLQYFYDSAVQDSRRRGDFQSEDDLAKLADYDLVRGCYVTGIITEVGYKHLDYIRDMRNHVSAAHPNQNQLTGLQLISWLETCVVEVLSREPEGPVVEVRRLLHNLRHETLGPDDVPAIATAVLQLPEHLAQSLLRSVFGLYTDSSVAAQVRGNIHLIAPSIWQAATTAARYQAGVQYAVFSANGEIGRRDLARQFLEAVDGLSYLPGDTLAVEIDAALNDLGNAHYAYNNFYNEPPHARALAAFIPLSGDVPLAVEQRYVKTLTLCRVGNGYGVSWAALPTYEELVARFSDRHMAVFVVLVGRDGEIASRLQSTQCADACRQLAAGMLGRTANVLLKRGLEMVVEADGGNISVLRHQAKYKQAARDLNAQFGGNLL